MNIITIGHPAYDRNSANRYYIAKGKAAAVRELRERGFKRDDARKLVNDVCARDHGYITARVEEYGDPIEINHRSDL